MTHLVRASVLIILLGFCAPVQAGRLMFGDQDSIDFVASTTLSAPGGSRLYLGHLVTMHAFLLPYNVESKGLVLGISGEPKKYIPLPQGDQLVALQQTGRLPNPLPQVELDVFDYLLGFSLELTIVVSVGYALLKKAFSRKSTQPARKTIR
jgi:hypothetical protein